MKIKKLKTMYKKVNRVTKFTKFANGLDCVRLAIPVSSTINHV